MLPKRQVRRPADVAFRLLNELEGLLDGIRADAIIHSDEVNRLQRWLDENDHYAQTQPFSEISEHLRSALADGVVTLEEAEDLLFVCRKFTPFNPYFDQIRSGVQLLMGLLSGVAADGVIRPIELDHLQQWIGDWSHLKGLWPYDECESVVTTILARKRAGDEAKEIIQLAATFPVAGAPRGADHSPTIGGICAVDPEVIVDGRSFVFTGDSAKATRDEMIAHIEMRGGLHHPNVRLDSHYVVVGAEGCDFWAFSCFGRKIETALDYRRERQLPIVLVHERDFWDALPDWPIIAPQRVVSSTKPKRQTSRCACGRPVRGGEVSCWVCYSSVSAS